MTKKLIAQGAEAKIFVLDKYIVKERFEKHYRLRMIDDKIRGLRMRREKKILEKLQSMGFPAPKIIESDEKSIITMEKIPGKMLKDVLNKKNARELSREIGEKISILHNNQIIHGDLTTSNMVFNQEIYFIDFGLSSISLKVEDKAVDLHVLKEALDSRHYTIAAECFDEIKKMYGKKAKQGKEVLQRLEEVELRGRYKHKT